MYAVAAGDGKEAIVDPSFAEQFAVAHPTERYAQVPSSRLHVPRR